MIKTSAISFAHRDCVGRTRVGFHALCCWSGIAFRRVAVTSFAAVALHSLAVGKKTPGGAGTHTGHADAQRHTDRTDEPHNHPNPPTTRNPHVSATTEAAADSRAAGPESTAPRGRLRRGHPQRTRPCLHPLPERLPAPARKRSAKYPYGYLKARVAKRVVLGKFSQLQ